MGPVNTWPPHPGLGTWQQESGTCAVLSNTPLSNTGSHRVVGEAALPVRVPDVEVEGAAAEVLSLQPVPGAAEPARVPVMRSPGVRCQEMSGDVSGCQEVSGDVT